MPQAPPAPTAPKAPGTRGYWWSGGLVLTAALLFTAIYLFSLNPSFPEPEIVERMDSGDRMTFDVAEGEDGEWAVYHSSGGSYVPVPCSLYPPNGERTSPTDDGWHHSQTFGGWGAVGPLETPEPGTYTLHCYRGDEEFALGDTGPLNFRNASYAAIQITILGVMPLLLIAAIVVGVVTVLRRRSARKLAVAVQGAAPHAPYFPNSPYPQQAPLHPQQAPLHPQPPHHPHPPQHPHQR